VTELKGNLGMKDVVVFGPLVTSSLAITWEVGRFLPTGGFDLFTLTDHLVGAFSAIPFALVLVAFFSVMLWSIPLAAKFLETHIGVRPSRSFPILIALGTIGIVAWRADRPFNEFDFVISTALIVVAINVAWLRYSLGSSPGLAFTFILAVVVSLIASADLVRRELSRMDRGETKPTNIRTKSGDIQAYTLMNGERGLLLYIPETKSIQFLRVDEVQSLTWPSKVR
jgi:hypothetical protein